MTYRSSSKWTRILLTSAALAAGVALAGCNTSQMASNAKANKPVPAKLIASMEEKGMDAKSPLLIRLFKQEAELEVWKQNRDGQFALLKTYPICRWSGELGPKLREGDRQAPEGFYTITPGQMNPQSSFYLSFNLGYPNAFDRSLGRTGSQLMIHGDCSSRGCYAMTDEQISEIYALGREAFFGGQTGFQVQAYPFRMTAANMAKHRNSPHMPFWKMIKQGSDHFEVSKQEPKVDVCENRYVFNADDQGGRLNFQGNARCPPYSVNPAIANAVSIKQQRDEIAVAELVSKGTPVVQLPRGIDGGMHRVFAAKLPDASTGYSDAEPAGLQLNAYSRSPGTIPPHVNPPRAAGPLATQAPSTDAEVLGGPSASEPVVAVTPRARPAAQGSGNESFLGGIARRSGFGG